MGHPINDIVSTIWNHLLSQRAKRLYLWSFVLVLASAIALRLEAAIYARRISSVVSALSTLRVGETSKAEALSRVPSLRPSTTGPYGAPKCDADECFDAGLSNGLPGRLLWKTSNTVLSQVLRWWGFRSESLGLYVNFTAGKVSYFSYHLMVSAPGPPASVPPPPPDGELGVVVIGLSSQSMINVRDPRSTAKLHPPYAVSTSRDVPSQSIGIALTPDTPAEIVQDAFDLRLNCMWSFGGCRRWRELLPSVKPVN